MDKMLDFWKKKKVELHNWAARQGKGSINEGINDYMELRSFDGLLWEYSHYEGSTIMDGPLAW